MPTPPTTAPPTAPLDQRALGRRVVRAAVIVAALVLIGFLLRAHPVDEPLARSLNAAHTGTAAAVGSAVYAAFEPVPAVLLTVALTALVWIRTRRVATAAGFAGTVALTWITSDLLKLVVARPRPDGSVLPHPFVPVQPDPSFPSGHAVFVTALLLAVLALVPPGRRRRAVAVVGGLGVLFVVLALAVDGVHWPTDLAASVVWALAVAPAARAVWVGNVVDPLARRLEQTGRHRVRKEDHP
ncbi:undecaprenyl-diphosphatase [Curtobacterium luteum]|uniref:Undecaprenyl-diphosphatase n=1 Tax=Curtobacterium luteum TaxID=33881 RepID=A0A8H9G8I4_9MICO|nr:MULTISPECIES: phosphatase PAP2 family protein [Curtobacterium]MBM7801559.1 undecaprenyl-diphosphatase [Curtobacterium luteum]NUU52115.1 phosphatase PAP2 family protein [Curtobacterium luteum]GGK89539.1 hypothetical protein GCM10009769_04450 [Curtobacterium luteum]